MNMHPVPRELSAQPPNVNVGGAVEPFSGGARGSDDVQGQTLRAMLFQVLGLAIKHRRLIGLFALAGLLGGLVTTILTPRVYSASTVVKIDRSAPKVGTMQQSAMDGLGDPQFYQTQYELIRSRSLADRVVTNLNLAQSTFLEGGKASIWSSRGASEPEAERDPATILARQRASVGVIMAGLTVQPVAASSLVRIRFSSTSPEWAQRISVAIAENYERSTLDRRFGASQHARNFLDERLQQLKIKLQDSEKQLIAYAQREGIVEIDDKKQSINPILAGLQGALSTAVTERVKAEQFWLQVQAIDGLELPQILNDKWSAP